MNLKLLIVRSFLTSFLFWTLISCVILRFEQWMQQQPEEYDKTMCIKTENEARETYKVNQKIINRHNSRVKKSYRMAENLNVALTPAERIKYRKGYRGKNVTTSQNESTKSPMDGDFFDRGFKNKTNNDIKKRIPPSTTREQQKRGFRITRSTTTSKSGTSSEIASSLTESPTPETTRSYLKTSKAAKKIKRESEHLRFKRQPIPDKYDVSAGLSVKDQENCAASWAFAAISLVKR